jgi:hypothetical protein
VGFNEGLAVGESVGFDEGLAVGELVGFDEGLAMGVAEGLSEGLLLMKGLSEGLLVGLSVKITSPLTPLKAFHSRLGENMSVSASTTSRKRGNMIYEIHHSQLRKVKTWVLSVQAPPTFSLLSYLLLC